MMSITLPRMNQLLDEAGMKALSAQCYRIQEEAPVYLVFEDLSQKSFSIVDRQVGLDLDHCLIALRNLGIFHASSVALREKVSIQLHLKLFDSNIFHVHRLGTLTKNLLKLNIRCYIFLQKMCYEYAYYLEYVAKSASTLTLFLRIHFATLK